MQILSGEIGERWATKTLSMDLLASNDIRRLKQGKGTSHKLYVWSEGRTKGKNIHNIFLESFV